MALPIIQLVGTLKRTGLTYVPSGKALYKFQLECSEKNTKGEYDNLYISGGSDYHGNPKPDIEVGIGRGNLNIPKEIIEEWL